MWASLPKLNIRLNAGGMSSRLSAALVISRLSPEPNRRAPSRADLASAHFPALHEGHDPFPLGGHVLKHGPRALVWRRFGTLPAVCGALPVPLDPLFTGTSFHGQPLFPENREFGLLASTSLAEKVSLL
jgi:hypothetical protein